MKFLPTLIFISLFLTIVVSTPTGRLAAFRNYGVRSPPNIISTRSERYDRKPHLGLNSQRAILGPRWNLPSQVTHGSYKVIRFPKDEAKSQQDEAKLTAGEMINILKPLKSAKESESRDLTREVKWGFW